MKKLISILLAAILIVSCGVTAFAAEVKHKYYIEYGTEVTDTIDTEITAPMALEISDKTITTFDTNSSPTGMKIEITEPCVVYAWARIDNKDQVASPVLPIDKLALNYEMLLGAESDAYADCSYPPYGEEYGEYEASKYIITSKMIAQAGGTFTLNWSIRAVKYAGLSFEGLGQVLSESSIAAYSIAGTSLDVPAGRAESVNSLDSAPGADVSAKYQAGAHADTYNIDIVWAGMEFDYNANEVWNDTEFKWEVGETTSWTPREENENLIKITNRSSVKLYAEFSFTSDIDSVTDGTFESESFIENTTEIEMPAPTEGSTAPVYSVTFLPVGTLANTYTDYNKIGTITISLTD